MKHFSTFLFLGLLLSLPTLAQKKTQKTGAVEQQTAFKRRDDEIRFQAKNRITDNLRSLYNTIISDGTEDSQRNTVIKNSYLPGSDQIFYNDNVLLEDDINPNHTTYDDAADVTVDKYFRNLDLFYEKTDRDNIFFTQPIVSDVMQGDGYLYVKVYFTSSFTGKHNQINTAYKPVKRVAELRAELVNKKWRTYITRLAFLRPTDGLGGQLTGPTTVFGKTDHIADSVAIRKNQKQLDIVRSSTPLLSVGSYYLNGKSFVNPDKASITFTNNDELFLFKQAGGNPIAFRKIGKLPPSPTKLIAWLQIVTGVAALGASYAGYSSLKSNYNDYNARLTNLNAEYSIWKSLTQQSADNSPAAPISFSSYASPGIYAVYGGGVLGTGLLFNGIRQLIKSKKSGQ